MIEESISYNRTLNLPDNSKTVIPIYEPSFCAEADAVENARRNPPAYDYDWPESQVSVTIPFKRSVRKSELRRNDVHGGWRSPSGYYFTKRIDGNGTVIRGGDYSVRPLAAGAVRSDACKPSSNWAYYGGNEIRPQYAAALVNPPCVPQASLDARSRIELGMMRQAKDSSLNAALALAESRQTAALIATYANRVAGLVKGVRRQNPRVLEESYHSLRKQKVVAGIRRKQLKRDGKTVTDSDLWLETVYGLRPLIFDTMGAVDQMQKGLREKDQYLVARASFRNTETGSGSFNSTLYEHDRSSLNHRSLLVEVEHKTVTDYRGALWFQVDDPMLAIAKSMGFTNPAVVLWDKIPLISLLTDWVLPIGQYLDLLDYDLGLSFRGGSYTTFSETTTRVTDVSSHDSPYSGTLFIAEDSPSKQIDMRRSVYVKPPRPAPPRIRNPFKVERAVSAVALLRQRLR